MTAVDSRQVSPVAVVIPTALGLIFCALNAAGAKLLCVSSGCDIYAGYTLGGLSINLLGAVFFAVLLLLSLLSSRLALFRRGLYAVLLAGLLLDTLFLIWQILYWPCTSCLLVALLLALCVLGARASFPEFRRSVINLTLLLWLVAFVPVVVTAGKELLLQPWPILGSVGAPVTVYFSPTCPTCEKTVVDILDQAGLSGQVAFYPIAKNQEDLRRLVRLTGQVGEAELRRVFAPADEIDAKPGLTQRWRLARNKMALARLGADTVPLVLTPRLVHATPVAPLPLYQSGSSPVDFYQVKPIEEGCSMAAPEDEVCE
ncbi:MAG: hypothetical protein RQ722_09380 [Desulfuromonadales bacterium]|nr:hypothetical protein [Desulfuromonadales bacterium]